MKTQLSNESVMDEHNNTEVISITKNVQLSAGCDSLCRSAKLMGIQIEDMSLYQVYQSILDHCEKHDADLIRTDSYSVNLNGVAVIGEVNGVNAKISIISDPVYFSLSSDVVSIIAVLNIDGELSTVEINFSKSLIPADKEITPKFKEVVHSAIEKLIELDCIGTLSWQVNRVAEFLLSGLLYSDLAEPHIIDKAIKIGEQTVQLKGNEIFDQFDTDELLTISI